MLFTLIRTALIPISFYGVIVHYTDEDNHLNTAYYERKNGEYHLVKELWAKTRYIIYNDIYDLFQLYGNDRKTSAIVIFKRLNYIG